jgi:hypothetical protein
MAWHSGSTATTDAQRAGELVGLGSYFSEFTADSVTENRPKEFFKALTPESGERAGVWLAHALCRLSKETSERPKYDQAYDALLAHFPLSPPDAQLLEDVIEGGHDEHGFYPPNIYPELSFHAMRFVVGQQEAARMPGFSEVSADPRSFSLRIISTVKFGLLWGEGSRLMFKLIDPDGYAAWAQGKDLPEYEA